MTRDPASPPPPPPRRTLHRDQANTCFGCGLANPAGLQLDFQPVDAAPPGTVRCVAGIPEAFTGAPRFLHGGIVATLLDEAMAKANAVLGFVAVTHRLEVDFLRPVPPVVPIEIVGEHVRREGSRVFNQARIVDEHGTVLARGEGRFVVIPRSVVQRLDERAGAEAPADD